MALFGRRKSDATSASPQAAEGAYATAALLPEPTTDWTDIDSVRAEWQGSNLTEAEEGLLGWRNGTRMYEEGPIAAQRLNVAEYITRGLAHHLYTPILTDSDAKVACSHVLLMIDQVPASPPFLADFGPRLSRLALTVIKRKGWQPSSLGGDGSISDEILRARPDGLVMYSARCPGIPVSAVWRHFFA